MRLTILSGGGFRVPLVYRALLVYHGVGRVSEAPPPASAHPRSRH